MTTIFWKCLPARRLTKKQAFVMKASVPEVKLERQKQKEKFYHKLDVSP